ncbi:slipin family protein [Slackia heliotrinireducens]|uniref:slipin family protein n=1 Tax=Slackia heliotrinireducens TaxID=84110 RepID=UPI003314F0BD
MNRNKNRSEQPQGSRRSEQQGAFRIESYNSPKTRYASENASTVFAAALFVVAFLLVVALWIAAVGEVDIFAIAVGVAVATLAVFTIRIANQWEKAVVLRFGKFNRVAGPGLFFTIPFVDHVALWADQRVMLTGFGAEETLTSDLVPINVDAAVFWMVWDAEKACMEVEDYYDAISLAAQTTLRDTIGRKSITDVTTHRVRLDEELKAAIEEKTEGWGVSVLSVEIRDIVIPKDLQTAMSAEARAERERDARMVLVEVEKDIAAMLHEAADIYREDDVAFNLRRMHLLNESVKQTGSAVVVPSAYAEGFIDEDGGITPKTGH